MAPESIGPLITWPAVTMAMFSVPIVIAADLELAASASDAPFLHAPSVRVPEATARANSREDDTSLRVPVECIDF
jgi:hypothetical protein